MKRRNIKYPQYLDVFYTIWLNRFSIDIEYSSPGGVQVSMGDWTKAERLLVGMGRPIFSSLCLASAACTASVWMSTQRARRKREK